MAGGRILTGSALHLMKKFTASVLIAVTLWASVIAPAQALIIAPLVSYLMGLTTA